MTETEPETKAEKREKILSELQAVEQRKAELTEYMLANGASFEATAPSH